MASPLPRAAAWVVLTHVGFEPAVTAGFLATVGFQYTGWVARIVLPMTIVKLLLSLLFFRWFLSPADRFGRLPEEEQARRPDAAATAVEAVLRAPVRFSLVQALLWLFGSLPVTVAFALRPDVSPQYLWVALCQSFALFFGTYAFVQAFFSWHLTPWAGRVSLLVKGRGLRLADEASLKSRLLPLAICLTMSPSFAIAAPGLAQQIQRSIDRARAEAQSRTDGLAHAADPTPEPGAFVLDHRGLVLAGNPALTAEMTRWFDAARPLGSGTFVDEREEKVLSFRATGDRVVGAVVAVPSGMPFLGVLAVFIALMIGWGAITASTLSRAITRPLAQLAAALEAVKRRGDLQQEVEIAYGGEIGRVAMAARETLLGLREIHGKLVEQLGATVNELGRIAREQSRSVEQQAASLAQAAATTHEIRQTSALAAAKAREVLNAAAEADELGKEGNASVEASLASLVEIKDQAEAISHRISGLEEQTVRVSEIVETVKDLADQSNILALNAGLEAAKAGEAARGFAVVAGEMRVLADRSLEATSRIRHLVSEVQQSIRESVSITEGGRERMEHSMGQIRASGDTLRALADRLREAGQAVRQIGASVSEQDNGIGQIVHAVQGLDRSMRDTVAGIRATGEAADNVKVIASRFAEVSKTMRA